MVMLRMIDDPNLALHERVAASVRRAIADGDVSRGDLLPRARDVAAAFGIHPNTVLRAYRALRDEGVVDLRAGRGAEVLVDTDTRAGLGHLVDGLLRAAAERGLTRDDVVAMLRDDHDGRAAR